ncbi:hypothetical protein GQ54DRAFT_14987 [Martensiomyces pterosporus]|nr:hypothetical protein GQ54DRAFT_14987 [Martensiomyces pterosporus]
MYLIAAAQKEAYTGEANRKQAGTKKRAKEKGQSKVACIEHRPLLFVVSVAVRKRSIHDLLRARHLQLLTHAILASSSSVLLHTLIATGWRARVLARRARSSPILLLTLFTRRRARRRRSATSPLPALVPGLAISAASPVTAVIPVRRRAPSSAAAPAPAAVAPAAATAIGATRPRARGRTGARSASAAPAIVAAFESPRPGGRALGPLHRDAAAVYLLIVHAVKGISSVTRVLVLDKRKPTLE